MNWPRIFYPTPLTRRGFVRFLWHPTNSNLEKPVIRTLFATLSMLALGLSTVNAEEIKGKVKGVNAAGNSLTLTVDSKDKVFAVSKDASFVSVSTTPGKKGKPMENVTPIDGGLGGVKVGNAVTVLTEKEGSKETVTSVKVTGDGAAATKKKKKKTAKTSLLVSAEDENLPAADKGTKKTNKAAKKGDKSKKKAAKKGSKAKKGKKKNKK
jgi:hypothetical protein